MCRVLLIVIALLASACSGGTADLTAVEPADATIEAEFVVESGLDAIAAAQGTPHILWFWGAY